MARLSQAEKTEKINRIRRFIAKGVPETEIMRMEQIKERMFRRYKKLIYEKYMEQFQKEPDKRLMEAFLDTIKGYEEDIDDINLVMSREFKKKDVKFLDTKTVDGKEVTELKEFEDLNRINNAIILGAVRRRAELREKKVQLAQSLGLLPKSADTNIQIANVVKISPLDQIFKDVYGKYIREHNTANASK